MSTYGTTVRGNSRIRNESPSHNFGFYKFTSHLMMTVCLFQLFFVNPINLTIVFLSPYRLEKWNKSEFCNPPNKWS